MLNILITDWSSYILFEEGSVLDRLNWPDLQADHSLQSATEFKNACYLCLLSKYFHDMVLHEEQREALYLFIHG